MRLCAHTRARDSVKTFMKHGVDIIYHVSWTEEEGMDVPENAIDNIAWRRLWTRLTTSLDI